MSKSSWWAIVWSCGVMFVAASSRAHAGTIRYVNTVAGCQGSAPCYTTIQAAITAAQAGDTVRIQPGTYAEQLTIHNKNASAAATEADRITIEADPTAPIGGVTLHGTVTQCTNGDAIKLSQSKFITIRGLTITSAGGQAISLLGGNNQNEDIHLERNRLVGNGSLSCNGGITVARGNPNTLIVSNLIYNNGRNGITFLDTDGGPHYLANNTIYLNGWNGIAAARQHSVLLVNNLISHNGAASGTTGGRLGVQREASTNPDPAGIQLLNNLVCGNTGGEIDGQILNDTDVGNLTPTGAEGPGVAASPGCDVLATLFATVNGLDGLAGTADDDFTLAAGSPAIDTGLDPRTLGLPASFDPLFTADYHADAQRPQDGDGSSSLEFDLGALEAPTIGGCTPGVTEACYEGPEGTAGVGLCHTGTRTCQTNRTFGSCTGQVVPQPEVLNNGLDEDCDGSDLSEDGAIPPNPSTVAPALDLTVVTDIFTATQFLYTGAHPIQTGTPPAQTVDPAIFDPKRIAVIRGKVLSRTGAPLPHVVVAVLNHPEFGQTLSRGDGMFDLVVNGGGYLTITYTKPGYLPAQRQVDAPWRDYVFASDVAMIQRDSAVTTVTFGETAPPQVVRGNPVTDSDGARRVTIFFPEGTHAELEYPDGTREPRTTLHIRATEYTVGDSGLTAMPAELPPSSAYTYAVELEADEAVAVGATAVQFDRPVSVYVENFLGFPVGTSVPLGFYDRSLGVWKAADNGRVIKIISITGGLAEVDSDGDGNADDGLLLGPLGITDTER